MLACVFVCKRDGAIHVCVCVCVRERERERESERARERARCCVVLLSFFWKGGK